MSNEFSVYQFFPDGQYERLERMVSAEKAMEVAKSYTMPTRPAVKLGIIMRVIVTDGADLTVFDWKNGGGVVFPPDKEE
jgi:enoyl-CoA hydratase/carnithine racemase